MYAFWSKSICQCGSHSFVVLKTTHFFFPSMSGVGYKKQCFLHSKVWLGCGTSGMDCFSWVSVLLQKSIHYWVWRGMANPRRSKQAGLKDQKVKRKILHLNRNSTKGTEVYLWKDQRRVKCRRNSASPWQVRTHWEHCLACFVALLCTAPDFL